MFRASFAMMALASLALACDRSPTTPISPDDALIAADAKGAAADGPSVKGSGAIHFGASIEKVSVNVEHISRLRQQSLGRASMTKG